MKSPLHIASPYRRGKGTSSRLKKFGPVYVIFEAVKFKPEYILFGHGSQEYNDALIEGDKIIILADKKIIRMPLSNLEKAK